MPRQRPRHSWVWLAAGAVTVAAHGAVLFLTPPVEIVDGRGRPVQPRMTVSVQGWGVPACGAGCPEGFAPLDTLLPPPRVVNLTDVQFRLPRTYPHLLWMHKEPGRATFEVAIDARGRPDRIRLIEGLDNGAEASLAMLLDRMRFGRVAAHGEGGVVATVEVRVAPPEMR